MNDFEAENNHLTVEENGSADRQWDLVGMCLRHIGLLATAVTVCGILGCAYFLSTPKTYESTTEILVETKQNPVFKDSPSEERSETTIETHAMLIRSSMILQRAVEHGQLSQLETFRSDGLDDNEVVRLLKKTVGVSVPDEWAKILRVSYACQSEGDCQKVVTAIAEAYQSYLGEKSLGLSVEMMDLISKGKDDLLTQLQTLESGYAEFQSSAPVLWEKGNAVNIHRERQVDIEQKRKELLVEKHVLDANVSSLADAVAKGGDALRAANVVIASQMGVNHHGYGVDPRAATESAYSQRMTQEIVDMMVKEKEFSSQYGDGHPELEAVRSRLSFLRKSLKTSLAGEEVAGDELQGAGQVDALLYIRVLKEKVASVKDQLVRLDAAFTGEEKAANEVQSYLSKDQTYRKGIERTQQLFDAVVARLDEISVIQNYAGDRISIIEPAQLGQVSDPSLMRTAALSILAGLGIGFLFAYRLEMLDSSFSSPEEVRKVVGAPILAQVPIFDIESAAADQEPGEIRGSVLAHHGAESQAAEVFRGIRTALYFSSTRQNLKVLQVTSPLPGDGKSTMISNLAVTIAQSGRKVVLVDADCRRPTIHKVMGLEQGPGLVDLVNGRCELDEVVVETEVENLFIIRSGKPPKNPSELLTSERFDAVLETLSGTFDQVLVDTPPVLAVSDGCAVAAKVDGVVLVLRLTDRSRDVTTRATQVLESVDANLIGVVVNAVEKKKSGGYGSYGYGYGTGSYGYGYGTYGSEGEEYFQNNGSEDKPRRSAIVRTEQAVGNPKRRAPKKTRNRPKIDV